MQAQTLEWHKRAGLAVLCPEKAARGFRESQRTSGDALMKREEREEVKVQLCWMCLGAHRSPADRDPHKVTPFL